MRPVLMVEPQGEGGVCHYTFCLSQALQECGCALALATGRPYELAFAQPAFSVAPVFGASQARALAQRLLRRAPAPSGTANAPNIADEQRPLEGQGGRASRWLRNQEEVVGWRRVLTLARGLARGPEPPIAHIQWLTQPSRDAGWFEELRKRGVRTVYTAHNVVPHDAAPATRALWRRVYAGADAIIVHYAQAMEELADLGVDLARVTVIPHGNYLPIAQLVAPSGMGVGVMAQWRARAELGLPQDAPVALCFGLMRPYKGIDHLLDAFARVHAMTPTARLLLVGRAPDGFGDLAERIQALGIAHAVTATPRYAPLLDLWRWFAAADVVVAPYVEASQSGVAQMAFAFARPVIVTDVGGLPEVVRPGATGLIIPPRDAQALAEALADLLGDRERCARWGQNACAFARDKLAWGPIAERTAMVYERVLAMPVAR